MLHKTLTICVLTGLLALSACGFRPLHSQTNGINVSADLASIEVKSIADRSGQILRNHMRTRLAPRGLAPNSHYTLSTTLSESIQHLAIKKNAFADRANLRLIAQYTLVRKSDNLTVLSSQYTVVTSYNITNNDYTTQVAQQDARQRALKEIADSMHTQLSVFIVKFSNTPASK